MTEVEIVQKIIEDELRTANKVSKYLVFEEIKRTVHPTTLFNKVLTQGEGHNDALRNVVSGSKKFFWDAMRNLQLRRIFSIDEDGYIRRWNESTDTLSYGRPEQYSEEYIRVFKDTVREHGLSRGHKIITEEGVAIHEVIEKVAISIPTLSKYVKKAGVGGPAVKLRRGRPVSLDQTPSVPSRKLKTLTYNGETKTVSEWAKQLGAKTDTLRKRLEDGWPVERVVTVRVGEKFTRPEKDLLLSLISHHWQNEIEVKTKFAQQLDPEAAIESWKHREETLAKYHKKKFGKIRTPITDRDEQIARGAKELYRDLIYKNMRSVERDGLGNIRLHQQGDSQ